MQFRMGLPETVDFARNFATMIRVQGPDPKGLKIRQHAFHHYNSGKTTLSASGMILPSYFYVGELTKEDRSYHDKASSPTTIVLTVASIVEPFISLKHRDHMFQGKPELISDVQIDIMVERKMVACADAKVPDGEAHQWLPAELLTLVDIPLSSVALQSLIEASSGSVEHGWEVGWSLALSSDSCQTILGANPAEQSAVQNVGQVGAELSNPSRMSKLATRIAILGVSSVIFEDLQNLRASPSNKTGDLLLAIGAPFGILSPLHFCNRLFHLLSLSQVQPAQLVSQVHLLHLDYSISVGSISNSYPPGSTQKSLFMADIRCLPGMEGGPIFGEHAELIGMLTRPLRQRGSGAEVQLVIPWGAISTACSDMLLEEPQHVGKGIHRKIENFNTGNILLPSPVQKAMASICLITMDTGLWASGILLNNDGLILTNAHLLEPWRFTRSDLPSTPSYKTLPIKQRTRDLSAQYRHGNNSNSNMKSRRSIRVRLDHTEPWIWCDARVLYVSKGPLDVALLQLEPVPDDLHPIVPDFSCPSAGSKAYVIGHGLFGPRCDFLPSSYIGVIAKVVKAKRNTTHLSSKEENEHGDFPAMIETTAAVHPGGSGGAIVNSDGQMIGLVTSNAKHGGGTVIPHLNFNIPCAALEPVFQFSKDMQDFSLLEVLDEPNRSLSSVWALIPPLSPKPGPSQPNLPLIPPGDKSEDSKGSRFAKFIAERHELFKESAPPDKLISVPIKSHPSKL